MINQFINFNNAPNNLQGITCLGTNTTYSQEPDKLGGGVGSL